MTCVFCDDSTIQDRVVYENDFARVFLTNLPIVPGHVLIVPRSHYKSFFELDTNEKEEMFAAAEVVMSALKDVFGAEGYNFAWNMGSSAGQSVSHLHLHLLPRKTGDTGVLEYEPRKFLYRPGSRAESSREELLHIASLIKRAL